MMSTKVTTTIDHIIFAALRLETAIDALEERLGVRASVGGQHPGRGTHNALLSLGKGIYLEIIAPDPQQPPPEKPRSFAIDTLERPGLVTWAARTDDLDALVTQSRRRGYDPGHIFAGGRKQPDGTYLSWQSTSRPESDRGQLPPGDGIVPFLIEWGETVHPSESAPGGCRLVALQLQHPRPGDVNPMLEAIGMDLRAERATDVAILAELETPRGRIMLR